MKEEILNELKARGLDIAEDALTEIVEVLFTVGGKAMAESGNSVLVAMAALLPIAKMPILALVDKIDGKDDEGR